MKRTLREYLELERLLLVLEETDPAADSLRDAMDVLWYRLDNNERQLLNARTIGEIKSLEEISLPAGADVFTAPPAAPHKTPFPRSPITGWTLAA